MRVVPVPDQHVARLIGERAGRRQKLTATATRLTSMDAVVVCPGWRPSRCGVSGSKGHQVEDLQKSSGTNIHIDRRDATQDQPTGTRTCM